MTVNREYGKDNHWLHIAPTRISLITVFFRPNNLGKNKGVAAKKFYGWPTVQTGGVIQVVRQKYVQVSNSKYYLCQKVFPKVFFYLLPIDF